MSGPLVYRITAPMGAEPPDDPTLLAEARDKCRRLVDHLGRDAAALREDSPTADTPAPAEGRAAYDRARAAAEELLRHLED
jgi:hypothetical protein